MTPETKATPALTSENQGHQMVDTSSVMLIRNPAKERRLARDEQRRATRALDALETGCEYGWHPSDRWNRDYANTLCAMGFDPEYVARLTGLSLRGVA